jgi:cytochrome c-type biogenesis protein CcmH
MTLRLSYGVLAVVFVVALAIGVFGHRDDRSFDDRVADLASSIRCPVCLSESVKDSNATASQNLRREIAQRIEEGQSDDEIRDYVVSRYGPSILLRPPASGAGALVWVVPVVAFAVGATGLGLAFRRWRTWT